MSTPLGPEIALRDRVGALLRASTDVAALVGAKIRDDVPSDENADKLPWICMGPISSRPLNMGCNDGWTVTLRVLAESADFTRTEAWAIARAGIRAVDRQRGDDEAGFCTELTITNAGDVIDPGKIKTVFFDVTCTLVDPE